MEIHGTTRQTGAIISLCATTATHENLSPKHMGERSGREDAMSKETPATQGTTGTDERLQRIEDKLDALLQALADEGEEEDSDEAVEVVTMDGSRYRVPRSPAGTL